MTPTESFTHSQADDISLLRAALFGAIVPPLLATAAFLLVRAENFSLFPSPFSLLFAGLWIVPYLSFFCAPFGVPFALLCGVLARIWLHQGSTLADVQTRLAGTGATCGLAALWGVAILVERLFDGRWIIMLLPKWPLAFWGAALVVGAVCGWLLPHVARSARPDVPLPEE